MGGAARRIPTGPETASEQAKILRGLAERLEHGAPALPPELVAEVARALDVREGDPDEVIFEGSAEDALRFLEAAERADTASC